MLDVNNTVLICIDIQESLARAMHERQDLIKSLKKILSGASVLSVPVLWTEQNPKRLGPPLPEIAGLMPSDALPISKMSFSCKGSVEFMRHFQAADCSQVLLTGIETHICVYQTALDLLSSGYGVQVVSDCVSSRTPENKNAGLEKIRDAGGAVTTVETVLFELLKTADAPQFREISRIVK